jgi:hypothetical protein
MMTDAELLLLAESRKKSGWLAALLNLVLPGAGYVYCGRWLLALAAIGFIVMSFVVFGPLGIIAAASFELVFIVDGFLCAGRANKKMIEELLLANAVAKRGEAPAT